MLAGHETPSRLRLQEVINRPLFSLKKGLLQIMVSSTRDKTCLEATSEGNAFFYFLKKKKKERRPGLCFMYLNFYWLIINKNKQMILPLSLLVFCIISPLIRCEGEMIELINQMAPLPPLTESKRYIDTNSTFPKIGPKIADYDVCPVQEGPFVVINVKVTKLDYLGMCCQLGLYPANLDTINFMVGLKTAYGCSGMNSLTRIGGWMGNNRDDNVFLMGNGPFAGTVTQSTVSILKVMCQKMPSRGEEMICNNIKIHDKSLIIRGGGRGGGSFVEFNDSNTLKDIDLPQVLPKLPTPSQGKGKGIPLLKKNSFAIVEMIDGNLIEGKEILTGKMPMNDGTYFQYVTSESSDSSFITTKKKSKKIKKPNQRNKYK